MTREGEAWLDELTHELLAALSEDRLMEETRNISRWVRLSGTPEERESVEYVRSRLAEAGLETKVLEHEALISLPRRASLTVLAPERFSIPCITHSLSAGTHPAGVEGELVDAGAGTADAYQGVDARGKVSLADGVAMPVKVWSGESAGAIGQVHINDDHLHEMMVSTVWGNPTPDDVHLLPRTPIVSIRKADGERLRSLLGKGPVRVRLRTDVDTGWRKIPLLVAELQGRMEPEEFVLFSGHIDSWHYGAMDNGTANATMIEVARVLATRRESLRRSLRLCFWSGHSHGRYAGSTWYADTHWEEIHDHCVAHVNIDSVGGRGAAVLSEAFCMSEARALVREVIRKLTGHEFEGVRPGRSGDQSFWGPGVPSLFMTLSEQPPSGSATETAFAQLTGAKTGGLGWWWHTTEDTVDKIDPEYLLRDSKVYLGVLVRLLASPVLPFRYSALVEEYLGHIAVLEEAAAGHLDLREARARAERLKSALARLEAGVRELPAEGDGVRAVNQVIKRMGRILIPLAYSSVDPFEHDPARKVPPFPKLAAIRRLAGLSPEDDEFYLALTAARRARNRLLFTLRRALEEVEGTLARLDGKGSP